MSSQTKNILFYVVGVIVAFFVLRWMLHVAISILMTLLPIAVVVGVLYGAYQLFGRKALGGGRRTLP